MDAVAKYTEKQMASLSADYGLDLGTIRGIVNNACRILEVRTVHYQHIFTSNTLKISIIAVRTLIAMAERFVL